MSAESVAVRERGARGRVAAREAGAGWRAIAAGPLVAAVTLAAALVAGAHVGVSVRDPDHVAAGYLAMVGAGVVVMVGIDVAYRAWQRTGVWPPSRRAMREVRVERWTARRSGAAAAGLLSFYVSYMAYRNLKADVPLVRTDLVDRQLADADRWLFAGHDPARLLHDLFGTGVAAHVFSTFYVAFIVFLPLSLAVSLVFARELSTTLFLATALSINWILGAASYFLLPSLGPAFFDPHTFAALPHSEAAHLQDVLLDQRRTWLAHPGTGTPQSIAAFASLHVAMSFTALLAALLFDAHRRLKVALWVWLGVTLLGTIYLGWHYVVDDLAGFVIGALGLVLARVLTGFDLRAARSSAAAGVPER